MSSSAPAALPAPSAAATSSSNSPAAATVSQMQAQQLFSRNAFLLIEGLPRGSELSLDGIDRHLTDSGFKGYKLIPPGWHLVVWSAATSDGVAEAAAGPSGASLRTAMWRLFDSTQVFVRKYDAASDRLLHPDATPPGRTLRSSTRHKAPAQDDSKAAKRKGKEKESFSVDSSLLPLPVSTIVSPGHLRSLDAHLAPYPFAKLGHWVGVTEHLQRLPPLVTESILARVIGSDAQSGDCWTDALAPLQFVPLTDEREEAELQGTPSSQPPPRGRTVDAAQVAEDKLDRLLAQARQKSFFGKRQSDAADDGSAADVPLDATFADLDTPPILLPQLDAKRSWPPGSTGSELTRWSMDKSWLLAYLTRRCAQLYAPQRTAASERRNDGDDEVDNVYLLVVFELSFLLTFVVHNAALMGYWNDLITLFCNAPSLLGAPGDFEQHPALHSSTNASNTTTSDDAAPSANPQLITSFLQSFRAQLQLLPDDFFSDAQNYIDGMQERLVEQLKRCRSHVARALAKGAVGRQDQQQQQAELAMPKQDRVRKVANTSVRRGSTRRAPFSAASDEEDASSKKAASDADVKAEATTARLVSAWRKLSIAVKVKFDVDLDEELDEEVELKGSAVLGVVAGTVGTGGGAELSREEIAMALEMEEGEDAPVIVMDD